MIGPGPVQQLKWEGEQRSSSRPRCSRGRGAGFYTVTGTVGADGSVKGTMRRRGDPLPPSYEFTGTVRDWGSGLRTHHDVTIGTVRQARWPPSYARRSGHYRCQTRNVERGTSNA